MRRVNCSLSTGEEEDIREGDTHIAATPEKLASGYSSLGFRAIKRDRLVRMAWGTYHTDHTVDSPSLSRRAQPRVVPMNGHATRMWEKETVRAAEDSPRFAELMREETSTAAAGYPSLRARGTSRDPWASAWSTSDR